MDQPSPMESGDAILKEKKIKGHGRCAVVFCPHKRRGGGVGPGQHMLIHVPKVGSKNVSPAWKERLTGVPKARVTESDRRAWLKRTERGDDYVKTHMASEVRVCRVHVDDQQAQFALLPYKDDPVFKQELERSLLPGFVVRTEEEKAVAELRDKMLRNHTLPQQLFSKVSSGASQVQGGGAVAKESVLAATDEAGGSAAAAVVEGAPGDAASGVTPVKSSRRVSAVSGPSPVTPLPPRTLHARVASAADRHSRASERSKRKRMEEERADEERMISWAKHKRLTSDLRTRVEELELEQQGRDAKIVQMSIEVEGLKEELARFKKGALPCPPRSPSSQPSARQFVFTMDWLLQQDDATVRSHTGLPKFGLHNLLIMTEGMGMPKVLGNFKALGWKDMLFLTLFFLKVDPGYRVLRSLFGVSSTAVVSDIIEATLDSLVRCLRRIVSFDVSSLPGASEMVGEPEELLRDEFLYIKFIADCTLIRVQIPGHHEMNKLAYSYYKGGHYGKVFVMVNRRGWPVCVTPIVGGAASDDGIILKNIDMIAAHFHEGDGLLYDKGVTATVKKALMERGIDVVTPATVHGGVLSRKDYEQSRDVSSARVLIENVNAAAKRFRILQHVIPSLLFSKATMIVEVCYMLTVFMGPMRKGKAKAKEGVELLAVHRHYCSFLSCMYVYIF